MVDYAEKINRASTPMHLLEVNLAETSEKTRQKKKHMEMEQNTRSPFLIGSIEEINEKIGKLDRKLQSYHELVCESHYADCDKECKLSRPNSNKKRDLEPKKEWDVREGNRYNGICSIKSSLTPAFSEHVKNTSKVSSNASSRTNVKADIGSKQPKFVELHQFPGYDASEVTPLPNHTSALGIFTKVVNAQSTLSKKPQYRSEFERLFFSPMSQAILQDMFWWFFLEKYQNNKLTQQKLFNRVAHNYVKLLLFTRNPQYRDAFLREYPCLLSQAVYTAFCSTFPDSYRQFHADFKEELVGFVFDWVAGLRPAPRSWLKWNLEALEPPGIKMQEEIMNQTKVMGKASILNFDFLDSGMSHVSSESTLRGAASQSSVGSTQPKKPKGKAGQDGSQSVLGLATTSAIDQVAMAQTTDIAKEAQQRKNQQQPHGHSRATAPSCADVSDSLPPIHESLTGNGKVASKSSKVTTDKSSVSLLRPAKLAGRESHPVGRGPSFSRSVFNIFGQSPLVAHFMRMVNLAPECGVRMRVQRTELEALPPLDAPTYAQLVREAFHHIHTFHDNYQAMVERNERSGAAFTAAQRAAQTEHARREASLLGRPRHVKRLSDLLMLELKRDRDSISSGAKLAVQAALFAQSD